MKTLGYLALDWISEHLTSPGDPTQPFVLTDDQATFCLRWYALDEDAFVYRRALLQQAKGWGKSPLAAAITLFEFAGPALPDGTDARGEPVGRPWGTGGAPPPWVQIAASSEEQPSSNVYALVFEFLMVNHGKAAQALGIDEGRTRLYLKAQPASKLETVTASAGAREGQRVTFGLLDETHLMTQTSGGQRLARTIRRNVAKMNGRSLECSNAHELGATSVAEQSANEATAGEPGLLYVARRPRIEPKPQASDAELLEALEEAYGDAGWVDRRRILLEIRDPATPWSEALRYFFNIAAPGMAALVDPARWAQLRADRERPERVALGFVGSDSRTATALVACTSEGHLFLVGAWERSAEAPDDWRIPRLEVHRVIAETFEAYDVSALYAAPAEWRSELEGWAATYGEDRVLEFRTSAVTRMGPAVDRFRVAVAEAALTHDGSEVLARHVANARVRTTAAGHPIIERVGPSRHIDACVAAVLAYEANATQPEMTPAMFISMDDDIEEQFAKARAASRPKPSITAEGDRGWHPVQ